MQHHTVLAPRATTMPISTMLVTFVNMNPHGLMCVVGNCSIGASSCIRHKGIQLRLQLLGAVSRCSQDLQVPQVGLVQHVMVHIAIQYLVVRVVAMCVAIGAMSMARCGQLLQVNGFFVSTSMQLGVGQYFWLMMHRPLIRLWAGGLMVGLTINPPGGCRINGIIPCNYSIYPPPRLDI